MIIRVNQNKNWVHFNGSFHKILFKKYGDFTEFHFIEIAFTQNFLLPLQNL